MCNIGKKELRVPQLVQQSRTISALRDRPLFECLRRSTRLGNANLDYFRNLGVTRSRLPDSNTEK
jgi:hypothetical protein